MSHSTDHDAASHNPEGFCMFRVQLIMQQFTMPKFDNI